MKQSLLPLIAAAMVSMAHAQDANPSQPPAQTPPPVKEDNAKQPAPLPKSLRGRWNNPATGHSDLVEIEVREMSTPREGKALVTFWPYCRKSETPVAFERKLKVWRFTAANCTNTDQMNIRVRPVEGKNRMEGWYGSRDSEGQNSIYLEW